jgi:hypothetical protein
LWWRHLIADGVAVCGAGIDVAGCEARGGVGGAPIAGASRAKRCEAAALGAGGTARRGSSLDFIFDVCATVFFRRKNILINKTKRRE